jgi:hypothetical protein
MRFLSRAPKTLAYTIQQRPLAADHATRSAASGRDLPPLPDGGELCASVATAPRLRRSVAVRAQVAPVLPAVGRPVSVDVIVLRRYRVALPERSAVVGAERRPVVALGLPPRHHVPVVAWQLGQSSRRFSGRSSLQSPLMWSISSVIGLPHHSGAVPHSAHRPGTPISRRARRSIAVLVRRFVPCFTSTSSGDFLGFLPGLPRPWACPRKWDVSMPSSAIHSWNRARVRELSGLPSRLSASAIETDPTMAFLNSSRGGRASLARRTRRGKCETSIPKCAKRLNKCRRRLL